MSTQGSNDERAPLLQNRSSQTGQSQQDEAEAQPTVIDFSEDDPENPRHWSRRQKMVNVAVIALMALLSPLASSMFTPGISKISEDLNCTTDQVVAATTGFVLMLGLGPLFLAPLSETFGRRTLYLVCFSIFSILQIPTAISPSIEILIATRTISGFFGSVGIANGGGTISDMFHPSERSSVFGWYLLGPLLGPTLGPLFGGLIVQNLSWRWVFWILLIVCCSNTLLAFFFLRESYAPVILSRRCVKLSAEHDGAPYKYTDQDTKPLRAKLKVSMTRPLRILFTQPIIVTMATYQAVIFAIMYTLFTNMEDIFSKEPYGFSTTQVGLLYLCPGLGFLTAVWFIVPYVDVIYNRMTAKNGGKSKPEYRLPLANIGAVLLPLTMLWFAWTVAYKVHWFAAIAPTFLFGLGQVAIFNTVQNYYIDAFEKYAASAIAAGAVMRSLVGGIVPLFAPALFRTLGYGWGWTVFAAMALLLSPSPLLFMKYGERIRQRFAIEL